MSGGNDDREIVDDRDADMRYLESWLIVLGASALLLATAADAIDVLARHIGWRLLGAIEVVRAAILIASSVAIVAATIARKHATVRLVVDRLSPKIRELLRPFHTIVAAAYFFALAVGCSWIAFDLRHGYEQSELLHIPYMPLRLFSIATLLLTGGLFLRRVNARRDEA